MQGRTVPSGQASASWRDARTAPRSAGVAHFPGVRGYTGRSSVPGPTTRLAVVAPVFGVPSGFGYRPPGDALRDGPSWCCRARRCATGACGTRSGGVGWRGLSGGAVRSRDRSFHGGGRPMAVSKRCEPRYAARTPGDVKATRLWPATFSAHVRRSNGRYCSPTQRLTTAGCRDERVP